MVDRLSHPPPLSRPSATSHNPRSQANPPFTPTPRSLGRHPLEWGLDDLGKVDLPRGGKGEFSAECVHPLPPTQTGGWHWHTQSHTAKRRITRSSGTSSRVSAQPTTDALRSTFRLHSVCHRLRKRLTQTLLQRVDRSLAESPAEKEADRASRPRPHPRHPHIPPPPDPQHPLLQLEKEDPQMIFKAVGRSLPYAYVAKTLLGWSQWVRRVRGLVGGNPRWWNVVGVDPGRSPRIHRVPTCRTLLNLR